MRRTDEIGNSLLLEQRIALHPFTSTAAAEGLSDQSRAESTEHFADAARMLRPNVGTVRKKGGKRKGTETGTCTLKLSSTLV
jgi:hypothetical protein